MFQMFFVRIIAKLFPQAPLVPLHDDYVCRDESVVSLALIFVELSKETLCKDCFSN